ncbi:adenylate kinase 8-like [Octopus vulgaris]|uniref:Adenylate kinase 8-like n=1 Tax=Octopus vulgaris TaxID=6645 RepID=A0AA36BTW4_OCTVU|nr:adenylate kinase 8-like [Octopus vulgaris]
MICEKLDLVYLNEDRLLIKTSTCLLDEAREYQVENKPVPTDLWVRMLWEETERGKCKRNGWVFEGVFSTREAIAKMQQQGIHPTHCIFLVALESILVERAAGKRIDQRSGDIYHMTFDWPLSNDVKANLVEAPGCTESEIIQKYLAYEYALPGLIQRFKKNYKNINADQPKGDILSKALCFLSRKPQSMAPHTPRVILLGAFGSGKKTQAHLLAKRFQLVNVSCSQLIKQAVTNETSTGLIAKSYLDQGLNLPDGVVITIVKERLTQLDCMTCGWVLHGFPRNLFQAQDLDDAGLFPTRVFFLDVSLDSILERMTPLRTDLVTGQQHHLHFNPPQTLAMMDHLRTNPRHMEKSVTEEVSRFHAQEEGLSGFYIDRAAHLNADQDYYTVFETIMSMIINPIAVNFD